MTMPYDGSRHEQFEWLCERVVEGGGKPYQFSVEYRYRYRHRASGLSRFITDVVFCLNSLQDTAQVDYLRYMASSHGVAIPQRFRRRLSERSSYGRGGMPIPGRVKTTAVTVSARRLEFARREEEASHWWAELDGCLAGGAR